MATEQMGKLQTEQLWLLLPPHGPCFSSVFQKICILTFLSFAECSFLELLKYDHRPISRLQDLSESVKGALQNEA